MFTVTGPSAVIATVSELKMKTKETVGAAQHGPVYLVRDGKPVAGIISMEMMAILEEALEDRRMARLADARLEAIRQGEDDLLGEDAFWTEIDARGAAAAGVRPRATRGAATR